MSIVVCDPVTKLHPKHTPHLIEFYAANKAKYDLHLHWELNRPLHKVQSAAVEVALEIGASHVLFTEHDQWAYPIDGLEVLLENDKEVVGLPTYMRAYPYLPMCMRKDDPDISFVSNARNLHPFYPTEPLQETDLITWAFTLVNTDVFKRMKDEDRTPWVWDTVPTDSHFCQHCQEMGISRWINASYFVNHGDLPKEHVIFHRRMWDAIHASEGVFHKSAKVKDKDYPPEPQNEWDPHGVVPYTTELQEALAKEKVKTSQRELSKKIEPVK